MEKSCCEENNIEESETYCRMDTTRSAFMYAFDECYDQKQVDLNCSRAAHISVSNLLFQR